MCKDIIVGIRRTWMAVTLMLLLMSLVMLCRAEPEVNQSGMVLLLANLAQGWLFFSDKALQWLMRNWKPLAKWKQQTVLEILKATGRLAFMSTLVALGAFILFAETCLPPFQLYSK
jgi:hypothetical protein